MRLGKKLVCLAITTISVSVALANPWPEAANDIATTEKNQAVTINVLDNDNGHDLAIELASVNESSVGWGQVTIMPDKSSVQYVPYADFTGTDEFWYVMTDSEGRKNAAKVIVDVTVDPDAVERPAEWPLALTDNAVASYPDVDPTPIVISVLDNDVGVGLELTSVNEYTVNSGKAVVNADKKTISYTYHGDEERPESDEFWYVFSDQWNRKNAAKVVIHFSDRPQEYWPDATIDIVDAEANTPLLIDVLANDLGVGLTTKTVNATTVELGSAVIQDDGKIQYTPAANYQGRDEFWYGFEDVWGRTNSAKVIVTVGDLPVTVEALNDTGVIKCTNYNELDYLRHASFTQCSGVTEQGDPIPERQDATYGRDATENDNSDGDAGFSFTKLDAAGQSLGVSATAWSCIRDNVTGMIWESKQGLGWGVDAAGLHSADNLYPWTERGDFVDQVNEAKLCGFSDWRVPMPEELLSIVNFDGRIPTIDEAYFPNTGWATYMTDAPSYDAYGGRFMEVVFFQGRMVPNTQLASNSLRLVRTSETTQSSVAE